MIEGCQHHLIVTQRANMWIWVQFKLSTGQSNAYNHTEDCQEALLCQADFILFFEKGQNHAYESGQHSAVIRRWEGVKPANIDQSAGKSVKTQPLQNTWKALKVEKKRVTNVMIRVLTLIKASCRILQYFWVKDRNLCHFVNNVAIIFGKQLLLLY